MCNMQLEHEKRFCCVLMWIYFNTSPVATETNSDENWNQREKVNILHALVVVINGYAALWDLTNWRIFL